MMEAVDKPINGNFFGATWSLPEWLFGLILFAAGIWAGLLVWKAIRTGKLEWRGELTSREESPAIFALQLGVTAFVGFGAVLGAFMLWFDLGAKS
ncbi:MAG: hypothetical protein ACKOPO_11815 [Novosphingobium sp.]